MVALFWLIFRKINIVYDNTEKIAEAAAEIKDALHHEPVKNEQLVWQKSPGENYPSWHIDDKKWKDSNPVTYISLWTSSVGGEFLGSAVVEPEKLVTHHEEPQIENEFYAPNALQQYRDRANSEAINRIREISEEF